MSEKTALVSENRVPPDTRGGLSRLDELPHGQGLNRGDGHIYFQGIRGERYRQPVEKGSIPPELKDLKRDLVQKLCAKVRVFDLSDPDDLKDYQSVMNDCVNGHAHFAESKTEYDSDIKNWRVLLRWYEFILESKR